MTAGEVPYTRPSDALTRMASRLRTMPLSFWL
jgi:hypothetical protein